MRPGLTFTLTLLACGGTPEDTTSEPASVESTSGGESAPETEREPIPELRATTPIPVPQPAVPREELSEDLQTLWTRVEEVVAMRPPEPQGHTLEEIQEWSQGPFNEWIAARVSATREVEELATNLVETQHGEAERAVGAALYGYCYEDMAASVAGAPVPDMVAEDPELLRIYVDALRAAITPTATHAFDAYVYCAEHVAENLAETDWAQWGPYCFQRAQDVSDVYGVGEPPAEDTEDAPADTPTIEAPNS